VIGSLCSGYEGLGMAVQTVLGGELAWVADNDPGASAILAYRYPSVPNLGDIAAADWSAVEPVDIVTAGFPCQDVSCAGGRAGLREGNRTGVWAYVARAISELRPSLVVLENVRGLLNAGADSDVELCPWCMGEGGDEHALRASGAVLGDLADLGYDARWTLVSAAAAGAPHRRERVFILARPAPDAERDGQPGRTAGSSREAHVIRPGSRAAAAGRSARLAAAQDADCAASGERRQPAPGQAPGRRARANASGSGGMRTAADTERGGRDRRSSLQVGRSARRTTTAGSGRDADIAWGAYELAVRRWERVLGRPAPRPTEPGRTGERLSPRFVEWMMGLPEGWVTDVPGLSRNAQLKALGNGVVPQQAAMALQLLLGRAAAAGPLVAEEVA
jgi:DNA (cytosine-5)-methyltransferase 1